MQLNPAQGAESETCLGSPQVVIRVNGLWQTLPAVCLAESSPTLPRDGGRNSRLGGYPRGEIRGFDTTERSGGHDLTPRTAGKQRRDFV